MLLTVILPTYNVEKYLRECLDSVLNQTFRNLEVIIMDDNSSDSTPEIIKEYAAKDPRIKTVFHKANKGPVRKPRGTLPYWWWQKPLGRGVQPPTCQSESWRNLGSMGRRHGPPAVHAQRALRVPRD